MKQKGVDDNMQKYAIELIKGNKERILETFLEKDEALKAGEKYRRQYSRDDGLISCICADFDENDNITGKSYKLFETW